MPIIDITTQFFSYVNDSYKTQHTSNWNSSTFLKTANSALTQICTLQQKVTDLKKIIKGGSRFNRQKNMRMIMNIKQAIKTNQQNIKRLATANLDLKASKNISQKFRDSLMASLQLRLLKITFIFKECYVDNNSKVRPQSKLKKGFSQNSENNSIDLSKSHFIQQTQEQLLEEVAIKQYQDIQKSINQISSMYKQTLNAVRMHDLIIAGIQNNVNQIDYNVEQGKNNISQVHRRQSKNRSLIIKVFSTLYVFVFVYIVLLS